MCAEASNDKVQVVIYTPEEAPFTGTSQESPFTVEWDLGGEGGGA